MSIKSIYVQHTQFYVIQKIKDSLNYVCKNIQRVTIEGLVIFFLISILGVFVHEKP